MIARTLALCGAVVAADQGSKALVVALVERGQQVDVLPGLAIENVRNTGVAFGLISGVDPALIGVAIALLALALLAAAGSTKAPAHLWVAAGLILGGAVGNLADRVRIGAVIDFLSVAVWPTFNVADIAIVAGVGTLLLLRERQPNESR